MLLKSIIITFFLIYNLNLSNNALSKEIKDCIKNLSFQDAILVEDISGNIVYARNINKAFIPASTLKIITALSAIHYLGENFRFKTEFYVDKKNNLKIKGYGDPFLISEIWNNIAETIAKKVSFIKDIVIDDSYFKREIKIPGLGNSLNPYDAPVGALCANFNTIFINKIGNKILSGESQTPLIPFVLRYLPHHITKEGRYVISHNVHDVEKYAAKLFAYFLIKYGVVIKGNIKFGHVNSYDKLIYTYLSKLNLKEIIKNMMRYSNNFIANQIMLVMGAKIFGPPATLKKGILAIKTYIKNSSVIHHTYIVEGSGLSRRNYTTCIDMANILRLFSPYKNLLKKKNNIYYKTGTLEGIKTRAGYILIGSNTYIFVISLNNNNRINPDNIITCIQKILYISHKASFKPDDLFIH